MRAGVYLRVSTDRQDTHNQLPALLQLCAARGYDPDVREEIESGAKARPVLEQLCDDARQGKVQAIAVWALDRLGRDLWDILTRIRDLEARGIRVLSFSETWIDTAGPARELLLMIFAWVAQFERQRLRERTRAGVAAARAQGKQLGRPRVDPGRLAAALAECVPLLAGWQGGRNVGRDPRSVRAVAARHQLGEGTLRRALAAARAKNGSGNNGAGPL